jgi:hypothetical protein
MDEELGGQNADEVLEAAWPAERRRARRRMLLATLGRTALFLLALVMLSLAVWLLFGLVVPWTFFAFMTVLTLVAGRPEPDERALLRRDRGPVAGPAPDRP